MLTKKKKRLNREKIEKKRVYEVVFRYSLVFLSSLANLWIFYFVFTPLTLYPTAFFLRFLYDIIIVERFIFINDVIIEISKACVAGSAYYLLFMLTFITHGIKIKKRAAVFLFNSCLFLGLNIARIIILTFMKVNNIVFFESLHIFFWYFVSVVYVFIVWLITIKVFNIESIPFYSDFLYIKRLGKSSKSRKVNQSK